MPGRWSLGVVYDVRRESCRAAGVWVSFVTSGVSHAVPLESERRL